MNVDIESGCRYQKALLWEPSGNFDRYGTSLIEDVQQIDVRWENSRQEIRGPNNQKIAIVAKVVVGQDIPMHSIMWEGGLRDLPGTASVPESGLCQVVKFDKTPDIYGEYFRRVVYLAAFANTLPTIE